MDLSEIISKAAPIIGGLVMGGPVGAGAAVLKLVASEFGVAPEEDKVLAAIKADPNAAIKLKELELRHKETLQTLLVENETTRLVETQVTMRKEIENEDWFVRRARPSLLWSVSGSVVLEILTGAAVIFAAPEKMGDFVNLCTAISIPQGVAAAMCGVYIKQRSNDKAIKQGVEPGPGLIASLFKK